MMRDRQRSAARLPRPAQPPGFWPLCCVLLSLTACGGSSAAEARKAAQAATSWAATAHMVGDARAANATPKEYAIRALRQTRRQLRKQLRMLQSHPPPAAQREALLDRLRSLGQTVTQMLTAVRQDDTPLLAQQLEQLARDQEAVARLLGRGGVRL